MTDESLCVSWWVSRVFALARAPTRVEAQLEGVDHYMLALLTLMSSAAKITLYTHTACPFAQRVWIALEHTKVEFERIDVNLYGSGGFDKRALKQVEERGGLLPPKGYIPVLAIGDDLFRESDHCVRHRVGEHRPYGRPGLQRWAEAGGRPEQAQTGG